MLNINESVVAGIIGNDLELRTAPNDVVFTRFNVSTTDEDGGKNAVNWHRCIATGALAERIEAACQKGTNIWLTGKIKSRYFEQGTAMKKEVTELEVLDFQVCADGRAPEIDIEDYLTQKNMDAVAKKDDVPY